MTLNKLSSYLLAACFSFAAARVSAHHSFATFDMTKQVTVTGTVREFQWQNPHIWLYVVVKDGDMSQEWEVEGGSLVGLKREGWSKDAFKPGDKVTITVHPKRDGSHGGSFIIGTTADGKTLGKASDQQVTLTPKTP